MLAAIAILASSCDDSQSPATIGTNAFDARWRGGVLEFALEGAGNSPSALALVAQTFEFDGASEILRAEVALHNYGSVATPGPGSVTVYGFVPADVTPLDAMCTGNECAFDHRGTYGDDGVLAPGETSTPVVWRLHVPGGQSFGFRARLGRGAAGPGAIAGVVFDDRDRDGNRDAGEAGVAAVQVQLRSGANTETQRTDATGGYAFQAASAGLYAIDLAPGQAHSATTALPLQVAIVQLADSTLSSFTAGDIGLAATNGGATIAVEGFAWADLDRDGQRDEGEAGLAGVKIEARGCNHDDAVAVLGDGDIAVRDDDDDDDFDTRTDAFGYYALRLPDCGGPWEIRGGAVDRHDRTTPRSVVLVSPPAPGTTQRADFGYAPEDASSRFEVRGVVFRDDDGDGIRDATEPPLAGVRVTAAGTSCAGGALASDRTDSHGRYSLDGDDVACPLPWRVQRDAVPGTSDTTPATVQLDTPPAVGSEYRIDFGVRPVP
jgi:hypothetical protein